MEAHHELFGDADGDCDPDVLMIATIFAAQGVMDQLYGFFDQKIKG